MVPEYIITIISRIFHGQLQEDDFNAPGVNTPGALWCIFVITAVPLYRPEPLIHPGTWDVRC